ncbi:hypothetical protein D3C87_1978620 [compost metagenome]
MAQIEHARREAEELAVITGIAEVDQGQQAAASGRAFEAGAVGHVGDRLAGMLLVKALDDRQAFDQAIDDVAFAH